MHVLLVHWPLADRTLRHDDVPFLRKTRGAAGRLAQSPVLGALRSPAGTFHSAPVVRSILSCVLPFYRRVYRPVQLPFATTRAYRRTPQKPSLPRPLFDQAESCGRPTEVGLSAQQPGDARAGELPRRLAVVKLENLLSAGCVNSSQGSDALS